MEKVKVTEIQLTRLEGSFVTEEDKVAVDAWEKAERVLRAWALTVPRNGAYDKVNFHIKWEDGHEYSGRFNLKAQHYNLRKIPHLANHVRRDLWYLFEQLELEEAKEMLDKSQIGA